MTEVVHVVLLTWREDTSLSVRESARDMIRRFPSRIDGIVSVAEGPSVSPEGLEGGLDYGFVITFDSMVARDAYLPHPVHVELAELLGAHSAKVVVYDVEAPVPGSS